MIEIHSNKTTNSHLLHVLMSKTNENWIETFRINLFSNKNCQDTQDKNKQIRIKHMYETMEPCNYLTWKINDTRLSRCDHKVNVIKNIQTWLKEKYINPNTFPNYFLKNKTILHRWW